MVNVGVIGDGDWGPNLLRNFHETAGSQVVSSVNFNAPGQVVIAGDREAVDRAIGGAKEYGARRAFGQGILYKSHHALLQQFATPR